MAKSKSAIKTRIKSINSTKKITGAMQLISNIKLQKHIKLLEKNNEYAKVLLRTVNHICNSDVEMDSLYLKTNDSKKTLYFVFLSDMGLCGGYSVNLLKYIKDIIKEDDLIYLFGINGESTFRKGKYKILNDESILSDTLNNFVLKKYMNNALAMFEKGEICAIKIIYTEYVNSVTFKPNTMVVLPFESERQESNKEIILEPDSLTVLNALIPLMAENCLYNGFLQAKTSEHASRRFAMENATDNANELIEDLTLEYNQARQNAITQEITEIISGADAL